ncbi:MAG: DJ-1/PfpI family protein, partial [Planctomycetia bacterium]
WGEHLAGIQNVRGQDIRRNATRRENQELENGRRHTMTVEVRRNQVRVLFDDEEIATHKGDGSELSTPSLWSMPDRRRLGIGAWDAETVFHRLEVRARQDGFGRPSAATVKQRSDATAPAKGAVGRKRVLLVVANHHFFYREYAHPRQELEEAGIRVTVAAGRRAPCRPHQGSGEGADGGVVTPDVALADVKAADYDAILFSGGWGASAYQFAFDGRYDDAAYSGDRAVKAVVNRLIGEFLEQDKYVAALCNAVSVLAWARVDGISPLRGKQVCAPTREAPPGYYDGRPGQPSCRWHPERNGAVLSPAGAIGLEGTAEDDVLVDGRIVTGEDDISAREMGRRLVELLSVK